MSDTLWPHGLCNSWDSPGQNTGVDSCSLLQGIFPTQGSNPCLPYCRQILEQLSHHCVDHNKLWKILQETGIPDHLTCLLRNLYAGQEATVRTGHGTTDWFQIGKGVRQGCILSPCLFNLYGGYILQNVRLDEAQASIKIAGRNIKTSDMQITPPLGRKQRATKEALDESERGEWKSWLKTQHSEN